MTTVSFFSRKRVTLLFRCWKEDTDVEIQALKDKVEQGLERRKVLKQINRDLKQKQAVQETALER